MSLCRPSSAHPICESNVLYQDYGTIEYELVTQLCCIICALINTSHSTMSFPGDALSSWSSYCICLIIWGLHFPGCTIRVLEKHHLRNLSTYQHIVLLWLRPEINEILYVWHRVICPRSDHSVSRYSYDSREHGSSKNCCFIVYRQRSRQTYESWNLFSHD